MMDMLTEFSKGWHLGEASRFSIVHDNSVSGQDCYYSTTIDTTRNLYTSKESVEIHGFTRPPSPSLDNVQLAIKEGEISSSCGNKYENPSCDPESKLFYTLMLDKLFCPKAVQ